MEEEEVAAKSRATACVTVSLWSVCSVSMLLINKLILSLYNFKFNMLLLLYQNSLCVIVMFTAKTLNFISFEEITSQKVKHWIPLDFLFVLMLYTGTCSLKYLTVPMVTVFKNMNNIVITFCDFILYRNLVERGTMASLFIMLIAAVLAAGEDLEFSVKGYTWTFFNCVSTAGFVLYMPTAMQSTNLSPLGKVFYNNLLSLPLLVVLDLISYRDIFRVFDDQPLDWPLELHILIFCSGILSFFLSLTAFRCMQQTSPTTYALVGSINKIPLTLIGVALFHTTVTLHGSIYVGMSVAAAGIFGYSKAVQKEKKLSSMDDEEMKPLKRFRAETIEVENVPWYPEEVDRSRIRSRSRLRTSSSLKRVDKMN